MPEDFYMAEKSVGGTKKVLSRPKDITQNTAFDVDDDYERKSKWMRYIGTLSRREEKNKVYTFFSLSMCFCREVSSTSDTGWCVVVVVVKDTRLSELGERENMFPSLVMITSLETVDSRHESRNKTCAQHIARNDRERFISTDSAPNETILSKHTEHNQEKAGEITAQILTFSIPQMRTVVLSKRSSSTESRVNTRDRDAISTRLQEQQYIGERSERPIGHSLQEE